MSTATSTSRSPLHLRVFLASPGDVADERALALRVLEQLQYDPLLRGRITVETVAWDKPGAGTPMLATLTPQEAIKQGLPTPAECDIVIVIFWARMGTPLPDEWKKPDGGRYRSGTEWEYWNAFHAAKKQGKPDLLLYHRTEKPLIDLSDPDLMEKHNQWNQVEKFFAAFRNPDGSIGGGWNPYSTPAEFQNNLKLHLHALIRHRLPELSPAASSSIGSPDLRVVIPQYLNYLQSRHQFLQLKGMGFSERVPLQLPLLDLYVPLQARVELPRGYTWDHQERRPLKLAGRAMTAEEQEALTGRLSKSQPVIELLQRQNGLIVLGDPGAGKTTFLKYLALKLARGEGAELNLGERLPILAPLSGYANVLEKQTVRLDDFIAGYFHDLGTYFPVKALLADALQRGVALLLLDGLDEVQDCNLRHLVVEQVVSFYNAHREAGNKFVLTSRIIGYREVRPVAPGLAECTLVDFDDDEIADFVARWTQALEAQAQGDSPLARTDAERERRELLDAVQRNAGVRQLAANPLLLTILALMKRQGVTLPERRVELYEQYVKTLLSSWNRARGLGRPPSRDLDPVQTVKVLAPLALWMHEVNPGVGLVKREDLRRRLETLYADRGEADAEASARQFLADVRDHAGLLLERGPGEYGFIHLTFEEYLAAVAIALQAQGDVKALVEALSAHVGESAWHEIGLLTVGYVGLIQQLDRVAGEAVEALVTQQPGPAGMAVVLAGEAVIDACPVGVPPTSRERVVAALVATLPRDHREAPAEVRCRAGRALAVLGDPRPGVGLQENGLPDLSWARIPGTAAVRESSRFPGFKGLKLGKGARRDPEAESNETWPRRAAPLEIADFDLVVYPVTVAQFRPFVEERDGYVEDRHWSEAGRRDRGDGKRPYLWKHPAWALDNHPVVGVTWYEAEAYCNWLNERLKLPPGTIRLPTEAEWEWAARGPEGRRYPWGNEWEAWRCNSLESGISRTSAVGCFPGGAADWWRVVWPNSELVQDLAGNVWEWTASEYTENYGGAHLSVLNADASDNSPRVVRGGSWSNEPRGLRSAARDWVAPRFRNNFTGFRLARTF